MGNQLQLLPQATAFYPPNSSLEQPVNPNSDLYWSSLLNVYGAIRPGISQIWLQNPYLEDDIVGTIVPNPVDDRFLIYNIDPDTLPQNTLDPIDAIINPQLTGPNAGLPGPWPGARYLIVEDIGNDADDTVSWGTLVAQANDIIEYNGSSGEWEIAFSADEATTVEFVTNLTTNIQYRYVPGDGMWIKSYEGWYGEGDYSIVI
jgi:hypothetical protein